jgi:hypothetical protein
MKHSSPPSVSLLLLLTSLNNQMSLGPKIDRETMGRLAKALAFIRTPDDPVVVALKLAAESGLDRDIKQARTLFLKLKPGDRGAALAMLSG